MSKICPHCGIEADDSKVFCQECGDTLSKEEPNKYPACGPATNETTRPKKKRWLNKNKIISAVIIVIVLAFTGPNQSDDSSPGIPVFDESLNQKENFYGINYQVPKSWKKELDDDEKTLFYGSTQDFLMVQYYPSDPSITLNEFIVGFKNNDKVKGDIKESDSDVNGINMKNMNYTQIIDGKDYMFDGVLFRAGGGDGIIFLAFYSTNKSAYGVFKKVISSVSKDESYVSETDSII